MMERQVRRARILSSVAATVISLACGTNYVYSAWAPQYAERLHLTATQSNLIGLAGNLGMYSLGVPVGMFIDSKGPQPAIIIGALLLGAGYLPFQFSYETASGSVGLMCIFSYLTGLGGCMAFAAAIKTSALNWPHHRGTATALPLAAFGLSAFFFSVFGGVLFPGDTSAFLMLLAVGTCGLTLSGFFFIRVLPHPSYHVVAGEAQQRDRSSQEDKQRTRQGWIDGEPGRSPLVSLPACPDGPAQAHVITGVEVESRSDVPLRSRAASTGPFKPDGGVDVDIEAASPLPPAEDEAQDNDETTSLMHTSSSLPGEILVQNSVDMDTLQRVDIRGWRLLSNLDFWQLFIIMGILAGIGIMTINNIGHDVNALWKKWDGSVSDTFLIAQQQLHVSVLSVGSFLGRLFSGVGSDFLVKRIHASRVWCLVVASFIFCIAQVCALCVTNPHFLGIVSFLSGLGYGFLFGVFPSIVAESFGIHGLSQNWGFMTLSPVISGNIFNLFYGTVFDRHTSVAPNGELVCLDGLNCYWAAYLMTLGACGLGLVVTLAVIRHQHYSWLAEEGKRTAQD